jgi:hypothetical protein
MSRCRGRGSPEVADFEATHGRILSPAYLCTLTNQNADAGPVHVHCFFPALGRTGDADVSNVVVNVTGP